jgi:hypothetical protein
MRSLIRRRLTVLEAALRPTRSCWIMPIQIGETAADALHRHARDPELTGHAFVMLPLKRRELSA